MNKSRRKRIEDSLLKIQSSKALIEQALDDEKKALDVIPDDEENEDKRDAMEEIISGLEDVISSLDEAINTLEDTEF